MDYLRSFIIGSSIFTTIPFYLAISKVPDGIRNYSYADYSMIAPIYLGLVNMLSLYISNKYNLTMRQRYLLIGIAAPIFIIFVARAMGTYRFTDVEWNKYYFRVILHYFFVFNIIVYSLESYLQI